MSTLSGCWWDGDNKADPSPAVIIAPSAMSYASPQTYTVGSAIATLSPAVTGTVTSYSVVPALPGGLVLASGTGQISGTPTTVSATTNYVVTATNAGGSTTAPLSITVNPAAPTGLSYASPQTYIVGAAIAALNPTVTGTVAAYSVTPSLPAGLVLNATTGVISGTPAAVASSAAYVVRASNAGGFVTTSITVAVTVAPPSALTYASPQTYTVGTPITTLQPTVTGTVASYSVLPSLPAGLLLNSTTGQVTGTPTAAAAQGTYTVVAGNGGGTTTFGLVITVNAVSLASWRTPELIEADERGDADLPQNAVNAQGDAIAVWTQSDGLLVDAYANRYTVATGWGTAVHLDSNVAGTSQAIQVAIDNSGNALAVWQRTNDLTGNDDILASRFTVAGGWASPVAIETGFFDAGNPALAMDAAGNALAVWWQNDGARLNTMANRYVAGVGWGTAVAIEADGTGDVSAPQVAFDSNGNAIAVWAWASAAGPPFSYNVWANRYSAGAWGAAGPIDVDQATVANPAPDVALDGNGNAIAVWHRDDAGWASIWSNRYTSGSGWGAPALVETDNTNSARDAKVALDASGNAIAVWTQSFGGVPNAMANRYTVGVGWGTAQLIETDNAGAAHNAQVVIDGNGNATAVWWQSNSAAFTSNIWANRFVPGSGWGTALQIDNDPTPGSDPQLGVDASGRVVAVWLQPFGNVRKSIWATTYR